MTPWSDKAEEQWWDAHLFGSQQFLLAALTALLVSKVLWLPRPENETGRSSETCDYSSFSLNNSVYWSVAFGGFVFWFLSWKRCAGFQFPHPTSCSASVRGALCIQQETFPSAGSARVWFFFFCLYILKMKALRLLFFPHRVNSIVYVECEF